jgi:hypothetical protein
VQTLSPNSDTYVRLVASVVTLIAAVIALIAAVINKSEEERKALVRWLTYSDLFLMVTGCAIVLIFNSLRVSIPFYVAATAIFTIKYIRQTSPTQRGENLLLVVHWSATLMMLVMYQLLRVIDQIGRIVGILEKMVH